MKKKLTKISFSALTETATLLDERQQRAVIGGDYWDDHGYWTTDSPGNMYWTRTSEGDGGSGYGYGDSGNNYNSGVFYINDAVNYLTNNALHSSSGSCARYVREALEAGGLSTDGRPGSACDYDTYLPTIGFSIIDSSNYIPQVGDIIVHEATAGHPDGHIAMYNGSQWISDFKQNDMYGGSAYRNNPNYTILRWNP